MCWPFGCVHSKAGEVIELSNVFHSEKLHWPFRANYQGRECVVVACEESWSWFSVMLANFLVVDLRSESEFQSSDCLQHTAMMLVYGSDLKSAPGSTLWGFVQLTCKMLLFKPWNGQVIDKTWQRDNSSETSFLKSRKMILRFKAMPERRLLSLGANTFQFSKNNQLDSEMLNSVSECAQYGKETIIHEHLFTNYEII